MTTHFILIRHGQTEWNRNERFRGRADIPLNETGHEQARRVAAYLANEKIAAIYSSPLQRTLQTATPLAQAHGLEIIKADGLTDVDVGALEGLTIDEARQSFPQVIDKWLNTPGHCKFPKGESIKALGNRIQQLLEELPGKHNDQTVVLVSHRVVCHAMLCVVLGMGLDDLWKLRQDNGCINRFEKQEQGFVVSLINETSHL